MQEIFVKRALAGGLWLHMMRPGWQSKVNWDELDLTSLTDCVAGQVFAGEATGKYAHAHPADWAIVTRLADGYAVLRTLLSLDDREALGFSVRASSLGIMGDVGPWAQEQAQAWRAVWAPDQV
jgi:hypothetical protein